MKVSKRYIVIFLIMSLIFIISCENDKDKSIGEEEIYNSDINTESQIFSLTSGSFVETYDLKFSIKGSSYLVELNSSAGVQGIADTSFDFNTAILPDSGYLYDTTGYYVIGADWMDIDTYNPMDHSIQGNGRVYFVRTTAYDWVKMTIISASLEIFEIKSAFQQSDGIFSNEQVIDISYSSENSAYFDFSTGDTIVPDPWDIGFITIPVYEPNSGITYNLPTVLLNYDRDVNVAVVVDQSFEDVIEIPVDAQWLEDSATLRNLGYLGQFEVLIYHPEPPYNHKVIVENPDYVYIIYSDGNYYKVQFIEYSSGILLFKHQQID